MGSNQYRPYRTYDGPEILTPKTVSRMSVQITPETLEIPREPIDVKATVTTEKTTPFQQAVDILLEPGGNTHEMRIARKAFLAGASAALGSVFDGPPPYEDMAAFCSRLKRLAEEIQAFEREVD